MTQVNVEGFEAVEMTFKNESVARIEPYDKTHKILDKDINPTPEQ